MRPPRRSQTFLKWLIDGAVLQMLYLKEVLLPTHAGTWTPPFPKNPFALTLCSLFFCDLVSSANAGHLPYKLYVMRCGEDTCPVFLANKPKLKRQTSMELRDSKASLRRASSSLLLQLNTFETASSPGYCPMSYPTGIFFGIEPPNWPC